MTGGELIGRGRELSVLCRMLRDESVRLVTVTGPAGVGKTRVAFAVADAMDRDGSGRVVRVELAPLRDPGLVAAVIAAAAGVADRPSQRSTLEAAKDALGAQPALLVLDNFEHVGAAAPDVATLLDACAGVTALVTSRHVLGLTSEHIFPLAPLALPRMDGRDPERIAQNASIALFVARARIRDPSFELTPEIAAAVAEICRRLDGLPLAIELVAARVAVLPPPALLARWEDAVGLDTQGARDLPPRQQTLRHAFDWSYNLLDADEQALLRRLAAFPGGFDIEAVEAACRGDGNVLPDLDLEPIPALARLVDRSLVSREPSWSTSQPRYAQLMTVQSYLREHLVRHGEDLAGDLLMAQACAAVARKAGQPIAASPSRKQLDRLEAELNNMRAALDVFVRTAPQQAVQLATDLGGLWETRHVSEGREWVERAVAAGGQDLPAGTRARGLWTAAMLAHYQGDYAGGVQHAAASLAAARLAGDPVTLARSLYGQAMATITASVAEAGALYRESLALCESCGDQVGIAMASNDLGELARDEGDLDEATACYERALGLWRGLDDHSGVARAAHNLAQTMHARGEQQRAGALLLESFAASESIGDRHLRAVTLTALVTVSAAQAPTDAVGVLDGAARAELERAGVALEPVDDVPLLEAEQALRTALGAKGFAAAEARGRALGEDGQRHLVEHILDPGPLPAADGLTALTGRQLEIVRLMAAGLTNAEIAQQLVLSDHTVHRHVANILGKLGVRSRAAAVSIAARHGLL